MDSVPKKNMGLETLLKVRSITNGECETKKLDVNNTPTPGRTVSFKYAPITQKKKEFLINSNPIFIPIAGRSRM